MKKHSAFSASLVALLWALYPIPTCAFAQGTSLSPSLASPLVQSTSTTGFNTVFDSGSSSFTNSELHTGISDPTHSQLLGSSLTPASIPAVDGFVSSTPQTGTLSDAQLAVQYGQGAMAARRDSAFASGAARAGFSGLSGAQSFRGGFGTQAAFAASGMGRSVFAGSAASSGSSATSSMGDAVPLSLDPRLVSKQNVTALGTSASAGLATDPVLTGALSGQEAGTGIESSVASPSSETAQFFASSSAPVPEYQYEDGQTPAIRGFQTPGAVLGVSPSYGVASNGFPDSTRGLAGLPTEEETFGSPLERTYTGVSPLASSHADDMSGLRQRLNPNLHASPGPLPPQTFEAFERRAQEKRLVSGLSISQTSMFYQQDLRDYQHRNQRRSRSAQTNSLFRSGTQQEIIQRPIR